MNHLPSEKSDLDELLKDFNTVVISGINRKRIAEFAGLIKFAQSLNRKVRLTNLSGPVKSEKHEADLSKIRAFLESRAGFSAAKYAAEIEAELLVLVEKWRKNLPQNTTFMQSEDCFSYAEASFYKFPSLTAKKVAFSVHRASRNVANGFRKLFKKEPLSEVRWYHEVDWERLSMHIEVEYRKALASFIDDDFGAFSEFILELNRHFEEPKADGSTSESFLEEALQKLDTHKASILPDGEAELLSNWEVLAKTVGLYGTLKSEKRKFSEKRLLKNIGRSRDELIEDSEIWDKHFLALWTQIDIQLGTKLFHYKAALELDRFIRDSEAVLTQEITPHLASMRKSLIETADRFETELLTSATRKVLLSNLRKAKKELEEMLENQFQKPVSKALESHGFVVNIEKCIAEILIHEYLLPEESLALKELPEDTHEPSEDLLSFNFQDELTDFLKNGVLKNLKKIPLESDQKVVRLLVDVAEVVQIVMVNLDLAQELANEQPDSKDREGFAQVFDLVHDGLDRAAKRTGEIESEIAEIAGTLKSGSLNTWQEYETQVNEIIRTCRYSRIRNKNRESRVISRAGNWKSRAISGWSAFLDMALVRYRLASKLIGRFTLRSKSILGYKPEKAPLGLVHPAAADYLAETRKIIAELPLIYRRLFANEALNEDRFFRGRQTISAMFKNSYNNWQKGHFANFIIVGEKGSGKTTCIHLLPRMVGITEEIVSGDISTTIWKEDELILKLSEILDLSPTSDRENLVSQIKALKKRRVVLIEGFQNIYLRHIGGFQALEAFLLVLSQTSDKLFWVVTTSRYGWDFLNKIYQTHGYFSHLRDIDHITPEVIEEVIMARHRVSGYDLVFLPADELRRSRSFRKLESNPEEQQLLIRRQFFKSINTVAEGNIAIAIQYWLRSIHRVTDDTIEIAPFRNIMQSLGDGFSNDDVFALGAMILHDDLTEEELSLVLNQSVQQSRLILTKLESRSILVRRENRYYLNHLLYRHVVNLCKSRNIIH